MNDNVDYKQLLFLLEKSNPTEIYEKLMQKEERVLDIVNRVVNVSNQQELANKEFMNKSLNEHVSSFFWTLKKLSYDLAKAKTFKQISNELRKDERPMYIGVFLLLIAIFLFFVIISSETGTV